MTSCGAGPARCRSTPPSVCGCSPTTGRRTRRPTGTRCAPSGAGPRRWPGGLASRVGDGVDLTAAGPLLGLAYPDRLAQARSGRRYRLRNGIGAWVPDGDALGDEPYLVVADVDRGGRDVDGRVRIAAAVDEADVLALGGAEVESRSVVAWDDERDDLRAVTERRLDALVLARSEGRPEAGPATTAALVDRVRTAGLAVLGWTDAARLLQARAVFAARRREGWPDLSDAALVADLDDWLAPVLAGARSRRDLERVDVVGALRARLGYPWLGQLDAVAPRTVRLGSGREVAVDLRPGRGRTVRPRPGPGPLRHDRPPDRRRGPGAGRRPRALARRSPRPGHRRPTRLLGRLVGRGPQGDGRPLPQAPLAGRPRHRLTTPTSANSAGKVTLPCHETHRVRKGGCLGGREVGFGAGGGDGVLEPAEGEDVGGGAEVDVVTLGVIEHGLGRPAHDVAQPTLDLVERPRQPLAVLDPLEVADGHPARVGQDVGEDPHALVGEDGVGLAGGRPVGHLDHPARPGPPWRWRSVMTPSRAAGISTSTSRASSSSLVIWSASSVSPTAPSQ